MNARFRFSIVALCISAMLAGCGSVTNGLAFQAPTGWTGTPALFGRVQMWLKSGQEKGSTQIVMLAKSNSTHSDFEGIPPQYGKNTNVLSRSKVKLCGTQPADEMTAEGTDRDGKKTRMEMVSTVIDNTRYLAMYVRPVSAAADAAAESSIHSLCPLH